MLSSHVIYQAVVWLSKTTKFHCIIRSLTRTGCLHKRVVLILLICNVCGDLNKMNLTDTV